MIWITKMRLIVFLVGVSFIGSVIGLPFLFPSSEKPKPEVKPIVKAQEQVTEGNVLGTINESEAPSEDEVAVPPTPTLRSGSTKNLDQAETSSDNVVSNNNSTSNSNSSGDSTSTPSNPTPSKEVPTATPTPIHNANGEKAPGYTTLEILVGSSVTVTVPGGTPQPGIHKQVVPVGSTIATSWGTQVQLVYPTGGVTRLDSNTKIVFKEEPTPSTGGGISIIAGRTWQRVKKVIGLDSFETDTASALASVRGTSYGHSIEKDEFDNPVDRVVTLEGKVAVKCKNKKTSEIEVKANEDLKVSCKAPKYNPILRTIPGMTDAEIKWVLSNLIRDEQLEDRFVGIKFGDPENPEVSYSDNLPPVVHAGEDITTSIGEEFYLQGEVSDDSLPFKATPVIYWASLDKGALIENGDQTKLKAAVSFGKTGKYRFRLSASDLAVQSSDEVIVTVLPRNMAPFVNLGPNSTVDPLKPIQFPAQVTDDGLPNNTLTYSWNVRPGNGTRVTIDDPTSTNPTFKFYRSGKYIVELVVSDGKLSSRKEMKTVSVTEPPVLDITNITVKGCTPGSSCSGISVLTIDGVNFSAESKVKVQDVTDNTLSDIEGQVTGGDMTIQILADFINLVPCHKYRLKVYFDGLDTRTANKQFIFNPSGNCKKGN